MFLGHNNRKLYNGTTGSAARPHGTSPCFTINRGVEQGCNISPSLSFLPAQVFDDQIRISQLADNTSILLKNLDQTPSVIKWFNTFSKASGLTLNLQKCELMAIHDTNLTEAHNIPIKPSVKYLGIRRTKETLNIENKVQNCKSQWNEWLQRELMEPKWSRWLDACILL